MSTAEWLSKYESIKDKLACKTEPPAGGRLLSRLLRLQRKGRGLRRVCALHRH